MKTSGIHFCYKRQLYHSHEQVSIHINTSHKTSTVQIVKNCRIRHYSGAPNEKILLLVSEHRFYVISVFFVRLKALFLNAKKSVSFRIR